MPFTISSDKKRVGPLLSWTPEEGGDKDHLLPPELKTQMDAFRTQSLEAWNTYHDGHVHAALKQWNSIIQNLKDSPELLPSTKHFQMCWFALDVVLASRESTPFFTPMSIIRAGHTTKSLAALKNSFDKFTLLGSDAVIGTLESAEFNIMDASKRLYAFDVSLFQNRGSEDDEKDEEEGTPAAAAAAATDEQKDEVSALASSFKAIVAKGWEWFKPNKDIKRRRHVDSDDEDEGKSPRDQEGPIAAAAAEVVVDIKERKEEIESHDMEMEAHKIKRQAIARFRRDLLEQLRLWTTIEGYQWMDASVQYRTAELSRQRFRNACSAIMRCLFAFKIVLVWMVYTDAEDEKLFQIVLHSALHACKTYVVDRVDMTWPLSISPDFDTFYSEERQVCKIVANTNPGMLSGLKQMMSGYQAIHRHEPDEDQQPNLSDQLTQIIGPNRFIQPIAKDDLMSGRGDELYSYLQIQK